MFTAILKYNQAWKQPITRTRQAYMTMSQTVCSRSYKTQDTKKALAAYKKSLDASGYRVEVELVEEGYKITGC